ncbi:unnamed protein product [Lepeophtheirus salmonis]|uniref:(salmon louse) hypothetical protein n=1 Tax=Lepeophtheirus salmonis TaxID=72036 RepID=A0A7R8H489_LEPSM|nr:unnamed protein product [Lepeophtheirus salmonis]CAF2846104.1 unnamed protein product [Lepeophtheirus salmonis]
MLLRKSSLKFQMRILLKRRLISTSITPNSAPNQSYSSYSPFSASKLGVGMMEVVNGGIPQGNYDASSSPGAYTNGSSHLETASNSASPGSFSNRSSTSSLNNVSGIGVSTSFSYPISFP